MQIESVRKRPATIVIGGGGGALVLVLGLSIGTACAESLSFIGSCARNPLDYRVGEEMTFAVTLVDQDDANRPVPGRRLVWARKGDDGLVEKGVATSERGPLVVKTRSAKPGFVRLTVNVQDETGANVRDAAKGREVVWAGGAGADVREIPSQPPPSDFDAFWDARLAALRATPAQAKVTPLDSRSDRVAFAKFLVPLGGAAFPAQGLVAWPKDAAPGTLPMEVAFAGYGRVGSTSLDERRALDGGGRILLAFTSQGEDPRETAAYYDNFRTNVCRDFCFRNNNGAPEETDFCWMLLRHARALQWAKTLPQWNGRDLLTRGGSMGGYQALGVAALDPDVSRVSAFIPWCADLAGAAKFGRQGGWAPGWTPALDYLSLASLATRVTCPVALTIGLGDDVCPPAGEMILYRNLRGPKTMTVRQNMGHGSDHGPAVDVFTFAADEGRVVRTISLDGAWRFRKTAGKGAGDWTDVTVPHDWAIAGPFNPDESGWTGKLPWNGAGEYVRTFDLEPATASALTAGVARAYLEFDGVMSRPEVFLNGRRVGAGDYGYLGFALDATAFLSAGTNCLRVTATTMRQRSRFYCGGGLYRSVRLVIRPRDHVVPGSLAITTPDVTAARARVRAAYVSSVHGPQVKEWTVERPRLWDVDDPHLYTLELLGERFRYGIRTATFDPARGFFLNGRRLPLKGVNLHADLGPVGMAFDRDLARRQLRTMRDMGANAIRTAHNCPDPAFLDLCDEMGFVVWDECFDKWEGSAGRLPEEPLEEYVANTLARFVRRDRNHPSVIVWSIGNEIWKEGEKDVWNYGDWGESGMNAARFRRFRAAVRAEDATRPVGIGCNRAARDPMYEELDLTGWNYGGSYRKNHEAFPSKPVVYSESASAVSESGFYGRLPQTKTDYARDTLQVSSYDHCAAPWSDIPDVEFVRMARDAYCAGEFVWTGIDYLGEPTPIANGPTFGIRTNEAATARSSYFGIVDLIGAPKDRFGLYRSHWNSRQETVWICPSQWNVTAPTPVYVYTSGDAAELFLNGRSLGLRRKGEALQPRPAALTNAYYDVCADYRLRWFDVPAEPGTLRAVAYRGGQPLGEATVRTAGEAVALRLRACPYNAPDARTRVLFAEAVDAHGVRVPAAARRVAFTLSGAGEIVAVGNANPRALESFKATAAHPLHDGRCAVYVRRTGAGPLALRATATGLRGAEASL